jgi:hypothetical protein
VIITCGCYPEPFDTLQMTKTHAAVELFRLEEPDLIPLAEGYRRAIRTWARDPRAINRWV